MVVVVVEDVQNLVFVLEIARQFVFVFDVVLARQSRGGFGVVVVVIFVSCKIIFASQYHKGRRGNARMFHIPYRPNSSDSYTRH